MEIKDLTIKEITTLIRSEIKKTLPNVNISVVKDDTTIEINVISAKEFDLFNQTYINAMESGGYLAWGKLQDEYRERTGENYLERYTQECNNCLEIIEIIVAKYLIDKSDIMTDFFWANFAYDIKVKDVFSR